MVGSTAAFIASPEAFFGRGEYCFLDRSDQEVWAPELLDGHDQQVHVTVGHDRGCPVPTVKQRQLPEEGARPESVDLYAMRPDDRCPAHHDEEFVARLTDVRQDVPGFYSGVARQRIDPTQLAYRTGGEQWKRLE
jgi:hypothetical protein